MKREHNRSTEQLARHSKVSLELVKKIERYRECSRGLLLNSYDKNDTVTLTKHIVYFNFRVVEQPQSK